MGNAVNHNWSHIAIRLLGGAALSGIGAPFPSLLHAAETSGDGEEAPHQQIANFSANFGELPPPPNAISLPQQQDLYLELIVNKRRTGIVSAVNMVGQQVRLPLDDLQRAGLLLSSEQALVNLTDIPNIHTEYRQADQSLLITADDQYLPQQYIGKARKASEIAPAITAFMLNYDLFASLSDQQRPSSTSFYASLYHEARLSGEFGVLRSSGAFRKGGGPFGGSDDGLAYIRYDTKFTRSDRESATLWEFGDLVTRNVAQASAVRLGGVQISRDFSIRPDIITYPVPAFAGRASLPSTVDLMVNGYSLGQHQVNAGSFVIDNVPPITGAGQAQLVVTDMNGRSIAANIPFYVSNDLLAKGLTDYAVSAGFFREDFGVRNFAYGGFAASAAVRHGLSNSITLEGRAEASRGFWLGGGGIIMQLGQMGIISGQAAFNQHRGRSGHALAAGYDYRRGGFSLGLRHMRESRHFADLGTIDFVGSGEKRQRSSAALNFNLGRAGQIGLSYADVREGAALRSRFLSGNYSLTLRQGMRISANAGRDFSRKNWFAGLSLGFSFGRNEQIQVGLSDSDNGARQYSADYSRSLPSHYGVGWNVRAMADEADARQFRGEILWRNPLMEWRSGAQHIRHSHGGSQQYYWAGASGAVALIGGDIYAANQLSNSFALVTTNGVADVPIRYENQLIGRSDHRGKLLIPHVNPWQDGLFSIDPLQLAANVNLGEVEQRRAIAEGRGSIIRFSIKQSQPLLARVADEKGENLPAGSVVQQGTAALNAIGWDGLMYLDDVTELTADTLTITPPEGPACQVTLPREKINPEAWDVGVLICQPI